MATNQLDSLIDTFDNLTHTRKATGIITLSQKKKPHLAM